MSSQKGKTNNPSGRPALPWDVLIAKKSLRADYDRTVCKLLRLPLEELKTISEDSKTSSLERILSKAIFNLFNQFSYKMVEKLLDRTLGKPVDVSEMEMRDTAELTRHMLDLPDVERIKLMKLRLAELEDKQSKEEG